MKSIKIVKYPYVAQYEGRWGELLDGYYVNTSAGYVSEDFWNELNRFQSYRIKGNKDVLNDKGLIKAEVMKEIAEIVGTSTVKQFNLRVEAKVSDTNNYIRNIAVFGHKSHYEWSFKYELLLIKAKIQCWLKNRKVKRI